MTLALFDITHLILIINIYSLLWTEEKQYKIRAILKQKYVLIAPEILSLCYTSFLSCLNAFFKILDLQLSSSSPNLSGGLWGKSNLAAQLTYLPTNRRSVSYWHATVVLWSPQQHTHTHTHLCTHICFYYSMGTSDKLRPYAAFSITFC